MRRLIVLIGTAGLLMAGGPAFVRPSYAAWTDDNCRGDGYSDSNVRRADAQAYAAVAFGEGYEWGGGCWNDTDRDDTPGEPDSGGEGPDCSGYVFKTWELKSATGQSGFTYWERKKTIHGPYTSASFHAPAAGWPFFKLPNKNRSTTLYMDAFAKDGHVALLYTSNNPSSNTDWIAEAYSDSAGVDKNERDYRYDSEYVAVQREDWAPDCYPNCMLGSVGLTVTLP
jgi:hypothetical protein